MFCRYCGKELADDAIFCDSCGKKLHDDAETVQKEPVQQKENSQVKKPKKKLFVIIGVILALIILIGAVFFIGYGIVSGIEVKMPDPVAFFDVEGEESESEICIYTKENPLDAVWEYIEYLDDQEEFDLLSGGEYRKGEDFQRFVLEYNDKGDAAAFFDEILGNVGFPWIVVSYGGKEACGCYSIAVILVDGGKFVMPEARTSIKLTAAEHDETHEDIMIDIEEDVKAESDEKENTETAVTVDPDAAVLPDPCAFFNAGKQGFDINDNMYMYCCAIDIDTGKMVVQEYIDLIESEVYQLQRTAEHELDLISEAGIYQYDYYYDYIGANDAVQGFFDTYDDLGGDVRVRLYYDYGAGIMKVWLRYDKAFEIVDSGKKASTLPTSYSGTPESDFSGSDTGNGIPEFARLDCLTCNGSGDCTECGGYGTIKRYNGDGDYIDSSCPQCNGGRKCRTCNGSGKR